jgi:uncharacterized protein YggE
MIKSLFLISIFCACELAAFAQEAGNMVYGNGRRRTSGAEAWAGTPGNLSTVEPKGSVPVGFIEANILLNVKADEYLAVFALAQEGPTLLDGNMKIAAQIKEFVAALESVGVSTNDWFVDFITQNRVYDATNSGNNTRETFSGFEVKKNITVRYKDRALLDRLLAAAAKSGIFDLVKVDYVVGGLPGLREKLLGEASKVIKKKEAAYARLFGVKMRPTSVEQEKYNAFFPSDMYNSYVAYESSQVDRFNTRGVGERKTKTFYYRPLEPGDFDAIIGPAGLEPIVQLTLYVRMKYSVAR